MAAGAGARQAGLRLLPCPCTARHKCREPIKGTADRPRCAGSTRAELSAGCDVDLLLRTAASSR